MEESSRAVQPSCVCVLRGAGEGGGAGRGEKLQIGVLLGGGQARILSPSMLCTLKKIWVSGGRMSPTLTPGELL